MPSARACSVASSTASRSFLLGALLDAIASRAELLLGLNAKPFSRLIQLACGFGARLLDGPVPACVRLVDLSPGLGLDPASPFHRLEAHLDRLSRVLLHLGAPPLGLAGAPLGCVERVSRLLDLRAQPAHLGGERGDALGARRRNGLGDPLGGLAGLGGGGGRLGGHRGFDRMQARRSRRSLTGLGGAPLTGSVSCIGHRCVTPSLAARTVRTQRD